MTFHLGEPFALLLLLALVPLLLWRIRTSGQARGTLRFSSVAIASKLPVTARQRLGFVMDALRVLTLVMLIVALARPSISRAVEVIPTEGIDIVLAIDVSYSMAATDMGALTRLEMAKGTIEEFVAGRSGDRMGLVAFASEAVTVSPLTLDYPLLLQTLSETGHGRLPEGTGIGNGLATAVNLLREGQGKSRLVILLTDGQNNAGDIAPNTAAEMAHLLKARVYTVGVGSDASANPSSGGTRRGLVSMDTVIDEETLRTISEITGGSYFRAVDQDALRSIYRLISNLETTQSGETKYVDIIDLRTPFLLLACLFLLLEIAARTLGFKRIP